MFGGGEYRTSVSATDPCNTLATLLDTLLAEQSGRVSYRLPLFPAKGRNRIADNKDSRKPKRLGDIEGSLATRYT